MSEQSLLSFDAAAPQLLTKANIQSFADKFIESVTGGWVNPLEAAAVLSGMESSIKTIKDGIRDSVISELKEGGKGSFHGVKIETMESAGRYDFSQCGDVVYNKMKANVDALAEELKRREVLLKALPHDGLDITDEDTGEQYHVYPPAKPASTSTYKVLIPSK